MTEIQKTIELIIKKYPVNDSRELFRAELEYLVLLANREGFVEAGELLNVKNPRGLLKSEERLDVVNVRLDKAGNFVKEEQNG